MTMTLNYDFATDKSLVARAGPTLTIVRASTASFLGSDGYIQIAGSGIARYGHDINGICSGLLIEEARTNIAIYSSDISNAAWVVSNVTKGATSVITPDGTVNTTVRLTASAANGTCLQSVTSTSDSYVYSVYMKRVTGTGNIDLTVDNGVTWTTKTLTANWTRFYVSDASETNPVFGVRIVVDTDAIDFWGSEVNKDRTWPTSYIPTVASSVVRNKDIVSTTDVSWLNESAYTFYFKAHQPYETGLYSNLFNISDGTTNNRAMIRRENNAGQKAIVNSGGIQTVGLTATSIWADDTTIRGALALAANDAEHYVDGSRVGTGDQSITMPVSISQLDVGNELEGSIFNGYIAELVCYDSRLTHNEVVTLTTIGPYQAPAYIALSRRKLDRPPTKAIYPKPKTNLRGLFE